jgi:hypothetical protein
MGVKSDLSNSLAVVQRQLHQIILSIMYGDSILYFISPQEKLIAKIH